MKSPHHVLLAVLVFCATTSLGCHALGPPTSKCGPPPKSTTCFGPPRDTQSQPACKPLNQQSVSDQAQIELIQELLSLTFIAYLGADDIGSDRAVDECLRPCFEQALATEYLPTYGWKRVWGPAVGRLPWAIMTDNLIFVAEKTTEKGRRQLAVTIRGTNPSKPIAALDWLEEDFEIHEMMTWEEATGSTACKSPTRAPTPAKISEGTYKGLHMLRGLKDDGDCSTAEDFVAQWCRRTQGQDREVFVTGHSLGGVLTPVYSLWLAEQLFGEGGACHGVPLNPYSFAAPTPGNQQFASCVEDELGDVGSGLQRIHNQLDVAPYVWAKDGVENALPYLYEPTILANDLVRGIIRRIQQQTEGNGYSQLGTSMPLCRYRVSEAALDDGLLGEVAGKFLEEAGWQHHFGYLNALELNALGQKEGELCMQILEKEWKGKEVCEAMGSRENPWSCEQDLASIFCMVGR